MSLLFKRHYLQKTPINSIIPEEDTLFLLNYLSLITLTGPDPLNFLQGQMTCDTRTLQNNNTLPGAFCTTDGRIIALATIIIHNGVHLLLPTDMWPLLVTSLRKPALFSRIAFHENKTFQIAGRYSLDSPTSSELLLLEPEELSNLNTLNISDEAHWHALRLIQGSIELYPETSGHFLPHQLSLDEPPYVDFQKGCYKGQEIIARVHYRSKQRYLRQTHHLSPTEALNLSDDLQWVDYALINPTEQLIITTQKMI